MNKKQVKLTALVTAGMLTASIFAGCGGKQGEDKKPSATANAADSTQANTNENVYPIKAKSSIKYWMPLSPNVSTSYSNMGDTPYAKQLEKETGVHVEFLHPAIGQEKEAFNILVASGDLPDIIEYDWYNFPGGPEKAISDGYILKLNDTIDKYGPNLKKYLSGNSDLNKMVKTDSGSYYVFPFIRGDEFLLVYRGAAFRKDWLDELKLGVPETMDEWYTTLKAFKEKKGADAPLCIPLWLFKTDELIGAYNTSFGFFVENGKVKYGRTGDGYKEFLTTMRKWYAEGLIDKNFATIGKEVDTKILNGKAGASFMFAGGSIGKYLTAAKETDPKFDLVGVPHPVLKKGDMPKFGQMDLPYVSNMSAAISGKSKNVETAARWLDYGFSEAGIMTNNFGVKGESYQMVNGAPTFTDLIMKSTEKVGLNVIMARYVRSVYGGPFLQDKRVMEQYLTYPQQRDAVKTWQKTDIKKYTLPTITPTQTESSEFSKIINDVNTYTDEMMLKFILGTEPMENYTKYVEQLNKLGIDKAVAIYQAALERYNKR